MTERATATVLPLLFLCFSFLVQVRSQTACPSTSSIFPPSGLTTTNYVISGSFLNLTSISIAATAPATSLTLSSINNAFDSIKFTVGGFITATTILQIALTPANFNCSILIVSVELHRPLFVYTFQSTASASPGAIVFFTGCLPNDCGDGSTNYSMLLGNAFAVPVSPPTAALFTGRLSNYESTSPTMVDVQLTTPYNILSIMGVTITLLPRGNITSVSPKQGQRGTLVTITGTNLLGRAVLGGMVATTSISSATFGGTPVMSLISATDTTITVRVNSTTPGGLYDILINTTQSGYSGPYTYSLGAWTQLPDGVVTSITPPSAPPGSNVTLCGQRLLGNGTYIVNVTFNQSPSPTFGSVFNVNGTDCLVTTVPNATQLPSSAVITLQSDTMALVQSTNAFRFAGIQSVFPSQGQQSALVTISGFELLSGYSNAAPAVYFDTYPASVISYNSTQIRVIVPVPNNSSLNQPVSISIITSGYTVSRDTAWTFLAAGSVSAVTPAFGQYGTLVTITGTQLLGYGSAVTNVTVGGQPANVLSYNLTTLVLRAPSVSILGLVNVTITSDVSAVVSAIGLFEYRAPGSIVQVSPTFGQRGTFVTITGSNLFGFGNTVLNVSFGNIQAVIDGQNPPTNTSIRVRIQSNNNTTPQPVPITILSDTLAIVQSTFNWIYQVEGFVQNTTPSSQGQQGTRITILGINLLGGGTSVQQVYLDGVNATVVSANSTAITVLVGSLNFQNASISPRQIYIVSDTGAIVSGGLFRVQVPGSITNVSPTQGRYGTFVTLTGSNLLGYGNYITSVTIAGVSATVVQSNSSWIVIRAGISASTSGPVVITADTGATVSSNVFFTYQPAGAIVSVVPSMGTENTSLVIVGSNLYTPTSPIYNITIGGSPLTVTSYDPTVIIATAGPSPSNLSDTTLMINTMDGSFVAAQSLFTYLSLNISLIGTSSGQEGTKITLRVPSPLDPSTCRVTVDGIIANIVRFNTSAKTVTVAVPRAAAGPQSHYADVVVQGGGLSVKLAQGFLYLQEGVINLVQPAQGQSGTIVTIQGTNILGGGNAIISATFNSTTTVNSTVVISNSNNTFVQLQLTNNPSNGGLVDITFLADTGAIIRRLNAFTYVQPGRISGVGPSSGQNGTLVIITGSGLTQGNQYLVTNVTLAGISAAIMAQSDTQITVKAAASSNATAGPVIITLSSGATISTANMNFQYLQQGIVQQVFPLQGTIGTVVSISGTNLLGNGTSASVLLNNLIVQVVNASSTLVKVIILAGPNGTFQSTVLQITSDTGALLYTTQFVWTFYPLGFISSVSPVTWQQGTLVNITGTSLIGNANMVTQCLLAGISGFIVQMSNSLVVCRASSNPNSAIRNATLSSLAGPVQLQLDTGPTITSSQNYSYYIGYISSINVTSGNAGTYVSISGAGFLPNNSAVVSNIFFGDVPVMSNFNVTSNNLITARVGYFNNFGSAINNITSANTTSNNSTFMNGTAGNITSTNTTSPNVTFINVTSPNITMFPTSVNITFSSGAYLQIPNVWTYTQPGQVLGISSSIGVPGDTITITGQNLVPPNTTSVQVLLGQLPAYSAQVVNTSAVTFRAGPYQTQLGAMVDQALQPLPIQITASDGTTVVSSNITFAFNRTGRIDSVSPMAGGNGSVVSITGSFLLGGNNVTSVTLAGVSATVINASENIIFVVAGQSPVKSGGVVIESGGQRLTGVSDMVWTYLQPLTVNPQSGQSGTIVNIIVPSQYTVQQVYLAGIKAAFVPNTNTSSQLIVRAGASSSPSVGDIVVQFSNGVSLTTYGGWTYLPPVMIYSVQTSVKYYNLSVPAGYYNISGFYNASGTNGTAGFNSTLVYYNLPIPVGYYNTSLNISGSGFQGGQGLNVTNVTLAGIGTTILTQSDTNLQLVISQFVNSTAGNITGPIVITSSQGAVYNSSVLFTYLQVQALSSGVNPNSGQLGTVVNISGNGLLAGGTAITQLLLAGYPASTMNASDQQITATASYPNGSLNVSDITYRVNTGAVVTIPGAWRYQQAGVIQQINPASGSYGTVVIISGSGLLGGGTSLYSVSLGSIPVAAVQYFSDSIIQVIAGDGPAGRTGAVTIISNTRSIITSSVPFSYSASGFVASITPSSGQFGTTVTIIGTSLYRGTLNRVTLAGISATITPAYTPSSIKVTANRPFTLGSSTGDIIITSSDGTITNSSNATRPMQFTYLPEGVIFSVSPSQGQYGTLVVITGQRLLGGGSYITTVLLGGVPANVISASNISIVVNVTSTVLAPSTGDVVLISDTNATVVRVNGWTYVPMGNITGLSPVMGRYGTMLNITGAYLTAGGSNLSQVLIGNVPATIVTSSDTLVTVQAGLPSVQQQSQAFNSTVTLISTTGGIVTSTLVWSYLPAANIMSIAPRYGLPGTNVTITGSQLLGGGNSVAQVLVVGIPATNIQSNDTVVSFSVGANSDGQSKTGSIILVSDTGAITSISSAWSYNKTCPFNTYLNGSNLCMPCHVECNGCRGPLDTQCLDCNNYRLTLATNSSSTLRCVSKCPGLATYGNICVDTCLPYQYMGTSSIQNASFCFNCSSTCSIYTGCTGPYPYQCVNCTIGTYRAANGMCQSCNTHCNPLAGCKGPTAADCYSCRNSSFLLNGVCVDECPSYTYILLDTVCQRCSASCGTRQCVGPLPDDCFPCPPKTYPDASGICQPCNELCDVSGCWGPSSSNCYNCTDEAFLYNGACVAICPSVTYPNNGLCSPCNPTCGTRGCSGSSPDQCYNCTYGSYLNNGSCTSTCPSPATYASLSSGLCLPCHPACGSAGCTGPNVAECNPKSDPFAAGSGTVGITIAIILMLALILAIVLVVVVWSVRSKKQKYDVDPMEMGNVAYREKEIPEEGIALKEMPPGIDTAHKESAIDASDNNAAPNLDGELYTGLGSEEEDDVQEKQADMSLGIILPQDVTTTKPLVSKEVLAEPEEVLGADGELYTDMHSGELSEPTDLKKSEVHIETEDVTTRAFNPYVKIDHSATAKLMAGGTVAAAAATVPMRPPKSQGQMKPANEAPSESLKSPEVPKSALVPQAEKRKSMEITPPAEDRRMSTEIKKPLEQRKSMVSIPEEKHTETTKPAEKASDKRKPSVAVSKEKAPPPIPDDKEPILAPPPDLELYTDMEIKSEVQEVYFNPQQEQEEYTDMASARESMVQEQYEDTAPFQSAQKQPTTANAKAEATPLPASPSEGAEHPPVEDMYEETDVAVELAQEYIKKQESSSSLQKNSTQLPLKPTAEKAPELPSRTGADSGPPKLPSRPPSASVLTKGTDNAPALPSRPSEAPTLPPARPRKSTDTSVPQPPVKTAPPPQPEETYESAAAPEEECLYEPIPGANRNGDSDSPPPPVSKPQPPASRKLSTDKDTKTSKSKKK